MEKKNDICMDALIQEMANVANAMCNPDRWFFRARMNAGVVFSECGSVTGRWFTADDVRDAIGYSRDLAGVIAHALNTYEDMGWHVEENPYVRYIDTTVSKEDAISERAKKHGLSDVYGIGHFIVKGNR